MTLSAIVKLRDKIGLHQFSTLISISKDDVFCIEKHIVVKQFHSTRNPFSIKPIVIVADPFLFVYKNELFLFYEEQIDVRGKGLIKMTKTADLKYWETPKIVLKENFHLSFPNVFELDGQIYMIPETGEEETIKLYKPNDELTHWVPFRTLLKGRHYVDSSIIFHNDCYFLFTTDYTDKSNILRLFYSNSLFENWTEHPNSPIAKGPDTGRNGGSVFKKDGFLFRPCQLSKSKYGEGLDMYKIETLSKNEYNEIYLNTVIPNNSKIYRYGGHHFDFCVFRNHIIVATDTLEIKLNYIEITKRVFNKLFKH